MKKWIARILIFGFLFVCAGFGIATVVLNWRDFFNWGYLLRLSTMPLFWFIFLIPLWIHAVSIRRWRLTTKRISIAAMVIISAGVAVYGFLRPQETGTSSLSWLGYVALALYFIASVVSAYFNWPGKRKESQKINSAASTRKSARRKNRVYVSIPTMTGTDGDATVTFINATFQKVSEAKKRFPDPDFGAWLIEQIYTEKKIMAEKRGAFKKKLYCPSCDGELSPEIREPKQIEYELQYHDFDPFKIQITIPSVTCPQCGRVCGMDLDGSLSNYLGDAIIAAFKSENIKP